MPITSEQFREAILERFRKASQRKFKSVTICAGCVHRDLGDYPDSKKHRMSSLCGVMKKLFDEKAGDKVLDSPAKGKGATLIIRYTLPRPHFE